MPIIVFILNTNVNAEMITCVLQDLPNACLISKELNLPNPLQHSGPVGNCPKVSLA